MLRLASSVGSKAAYFAFQRAQEVEHLSLKGLGYFKRALGMDDYLTHYQSWIARPDAHLLGCVNGGSLLGWCMFEHWERSDRDRTPIYVLRMIEVQPKYRKQKIGLNLMALVSLVAPGHIVTRPLSAKSRSFFQKLGFIEPPPGAQIDFHDKYGYLLLPSSIKRRFLGQARDERLELHSDNITKYSGQLKTLLLREEISKSPGFAQAFMNALSAPATNPGEEGAEKVLIKTDTARIPCQCGSTTIEFYTISNGERDHLSVQCARCGDIWLTIPI